MTEAVIVFDADGTGHCLYTEAIPLAEIGRLKMRRASSVEWSATCQLWSVLLNPEDGPQQILFSHHSREACLRWEREHFNTQLLAT